MITQDITINGVTYTVSATTQRGVDEAVEFLQQSLNKWEDQEADVQEEPKKKRKKSE